MRKKISLNGSNWFLKRATGAGKAPSSERGWLKITVPVDVRAALFAAGKIPDPYYSTLSKRSDWIARHKWWYRTSFTLPPSTERKRILIRFHSVDYYSKFWLNGVYLGRNEGSFTPITFDVTKSVRVGCTNTLLCLVSIPLAPIKDNKKKALYLRPQVSYGWDHSAPMLTLGIYDDVELEVRDNITIDALRVESRPVNGYKNATVRIRASVIADNNVGTCRLQAEIQPCNFRGKRYYNEQMVRLSEGSREMSVRMQLEDVSLWYPWPLGQPNLYEVKISIYKGKTILDRRSLRIGIREVKLLPNKGYRRQPLPSIHDWTNNFFYEASREQGIPFPQRPKKGTYNWTVTINGKSLFVVGGNWLPADLLFSRATRDMYLRLVKQAQHGGLSVLRIWGGGTIEKQSFFDACDEQGIMIWHDFPLGHDPVRSRPSYLALLERQCRQILRKLRHHPSIIAWDGGNELYGALEKHYPLFDVLRHVCDEEMPGIVFRETSPVHPEQHGPWMFDPDHYSRWDSLKTTFQSEAGCAGMPDMASIKQFLSPHTRWPVNSTWRHRIPDPGYFLYFERYPRYLYRADELTLRRYVQASQFVQAEAYRYMLESLRRRKPAASGIFIWEYNEPWPAMRHSIIDWYGRPKQSYYWLKKAARELLLTASFKRVVWNAGEEFHARVWLSTIVGCNSGQQVRAVAILRDSKWRVLMRQEAEVTVQSESFEVMCIQWQIPRHYKGALFLELVIPAQRGTRNIYPFTVFPLPRQELARVLLISDAPYEEETLVGYLRSFGISVSRARAYGKKINLPYTTLNEFLSHYDGVILGPMWDPKKQLGARQLRLIASAVRKGMGLVVLNQSYDYGGKFRLNLSQLKGTELGKILPVIVPAKWNPAFHSEAVQNHRIAQDSALRELDLPKFFILPSHGLSRLKEGRVIMSVNKTPVVLDRPVGTGRVVVFLGAYVGKFISTFMRSWTSYYGFITRLVLHSAQRVDAKALSAIGRCEPERLFAPLAHLPDASVTVEAPSTIVLKKGKASIIVKLTNTSDAIALYVQLTLNAGDMLTYMNDNFLVLPPHTSKTVGVDLESASTSHRNTHVARLIVQGWNISKHSKTINIASRTS